MAKGDERIFEVLCPCCQATLKIDPGTRAVIAHHAPEKPRTIEDISAGLERLKGEAAKREEAFRKSFEAEKMGAEIRARKFDELFKKAIENPDEPPPKRDIDL
jgi:hypothetical protein